MAVNPIRTDAQALVPYEPAQTPELSFNDRQIDLIKRVVAPGVTDDELALFMEVVRATGLNPLFKQIYAIKRSSKNDGGESRMTIQTGIDGYRLLASRTGQLAGIDDPQYDTEDGKHPNRATVTVYRLVAGQRVPYTATARWREYAAVNKDGAPIAMWAKMPWLMLGKCAEALALRRAFPAELSGVYTGEEMAQADNPPVSYVEAEHFPATPEKLLNPKRDPNYPRRPHRIEDDPSEQHAADVTPAQPVKPQKMAASSGWKALIDPEVIAHLLSLGISGREPVMAFMKTMKAEMEAEGKPWTRDQVLDHLRSTYVPEALTAEHFDENDANDLSTIDTGAPGN